MHTVIIFIAQCNFGKGRHVFWHAMATTSDDLYDVLEVNKTANSDEIKQSYQRLVKQVAQAHYM